MFRYLPLIGFLILKLSPSPAQSNKLASQLFEKGENQLNSGHYQEAIQTFSKVITLRVDYADAYYYRGVSKEKCNDLEAALFDYTITLEWQNDFAEALLRRARLYFRTERYAAAESDFRKLLTIPQGETHDIMYRKSSYEQGVNRIITAQGATDIIFNYLGMIAIKNQQYEEAIVWLDSAINLFNADADYYVNRGEAKENLMRYDEATVDYGRALRISPDHAFAQQHLSSLARMQGNIDQSFLYLSVAIEQNPHLPYAYLERAYYRSEGGDYLGAIADYTAALIIDSLDAEVWVNRGLAYEKVNDLSAAFSDFSKAIHIDDKLSNAWMSRANVLTKQNKFDDALEDYSIAIYSDPNYSLAYFNRALIRYRIGEKKLACEDLSKAESLGQVVQKNIKNKICESDAY